MNGRDPGRGCRRLGDVALVGCALLAIVAVPATSLSWPWRVALLVPAIVFGLLPHRSARPFRRALAGVALQVAACVAAFQLDGPLAQPAALAGTILPPLAFVCARRQEGDAQLGLFLAFCVLLIGTILGSPRPIAIAAFAAAATLQLRCAARWHALGRCHSPPCGRPTSAAAQIVMGLRLATGVLIAALAVERTLAFLPSPSRAATARPAQSSPAHRVGLSDSFDLTGDGPVLDLLGEHIVTVAAADHAPVASDLYLRSGFFQVPGLDTWRVGTLAPRHRDASAADCRLRPPLAGHPVRRLEVTRLHGARNRVFVLPGTCTILGVPDLLGDFDREWFRQRNGSRVDVYEIVYQDLPAPNDDAPVDPRWQQAGLLDLPDDLDPAAFRPLLTEFAVRGGALARAAAIARGLQARCRYELREPEGPFGHALLDFLHGERFGFCMHFASAAAILLRLSGVPCRIGVGLYGGSAGRDGAREFGSQHSHAWVEIPIAGHGWFTYDPTPPTSRGTRAAPLPTPATADDAGQTMDGDSTLAHLGRTLQRWSRTVWPWLLLLALLALPLRAGRSAPTARTTPPGLRPARRWLVRILRELAERGHLRRHGLTLEQFAAHLAQQSACPGALRAAFAIYQDVRFGGRPWDHEREQRMAEGLAAASALPHPTPTSVHPPADGQRPQD